MTITRDRTREWARLGAGARLAEIEQEREAILKEFPELRRTGGRPSAGAVRSRPRRKLTAAERRKLSRGMRKYWAKRKASAATSKA